MPDNEGVNQSRFRLRNFVASIGSGGGGSTQEPDTTFDQIVAFDFKDTSDVVMLEATDWLGEVELVVREDIDAV